VVYNFFALPPVTKSFCPVAIEVGAKILAMPSSQLLAYAPEALTQLEKPFQEFYAAYADYLRRLAEWQSRFGGTVSVVVSPTPLPPPPTPPKEVTADFAAQSSIPPSARVPGAPVRVEVPTFPLTPMRETYIPMQ
jgi:hypothetical protein